MRRGKGADGAGEAFRRHGGERRFATVVDLVSESGSAFKATARRYSLCAADAEDAYQRGLEILLTKAPSQEPAQLRPWLHTVIKHEALAVRRQRERLLAGADPALETEGLASGWSPEEGASERQRAHRTAEALGQLKSSEVLCMLLKALGYSYDEISERTGFSWTKVNRSLTEGRRRFFESFAQIESGERCDRFRPLVSTVCDGEASGDERRMLATHLRGCQSCRAAVRDYRAAPARLAELLPPALFAPLLSHRGTWWSRVYESVVGGAGDRVGALGAKLQQAGEGLSAQKATAVVASTAALAGGAAVQEHGHHHRHHHAQASANVRLASETDAGSGETVAAPPPTVAPDPPPSNTEAESQTAESPTPAAEFTPEAGAPVSESPPQKTGSSGSGGGEFGP